MRPRKLWLLMGAWLLASPAGAATPDGVDFFEQKIRPVLAEHCYSCHSARANKVRGKLLLDTRQGLLKGGASGPSLVAGKPAQSLLLEVLRYDGDVRMPPKAKLPDAVIQDFTRWIEKGAPDPRNGSETSSGGIDWKTARRFWSFQPLHNPAIPAVKGASWPRTSIDHFILARLESEHLTPAAAADRRTLLRRATFDLTGLPPTPEEIAAFEADTSTDAFARVVDRLLASPHYGERWGRYWLDVARYAEDQAHTFGVKPYTSAWRYRDWVIAALNADMPFDRFVKLQIAADLMDDGSPEGMASRAALGFFGLGAQYYDNKDPKAAADELDDRVDTLARGFLGLTVSCARCHDHKFDPIPQQDYYSLAGVFKSCKMSEVFLASGPQVERYQAAQKRLQAAEKALRQLAAGKQKGLSEAERKQRMAKMRAECERCKKEMPPAPPLAHGLAEAAPGDMRVFLRGDPLQPGEVAPRRFPRILAGDRRPHFTQGSGRLQLAEAIASKDNPLTARVIVNRAWQHHFGRGIVGTPSNFGQLGERPTHPELLDYLAGRLIASGWSLKQLHRDIMLSAVYQQSSRADQPAAAQADPDNRLLWRGSRRRLDVEAYRDALLAVSGRLDHSFGGPTMNLDSADNRRRTVYGKISRHELSGLLRLFDFPDANITSDRRTETTVPQQQLFVLNSPFFIAQAKALAERAAGLPDDNARIESLYRLAFGRAPTPAELRLGLGYLRGKDAAGEQGRNQLTRWQRYAQVLLGSNEFLYLD
jgi:mono/diheme cytochrome c family protein